MKPFNFRLQTKLEITLRQEQMAREELQARITECDEIKAELKQKHLKLSEIENVIRYTDNSLCSIYEIITKREYIPVLKVQIKEVEDKLFEAQQRLEKSRLKLLEKTKESKTLEKLKEKEWKLYLHELYLEEQRLIDEIAGNNHYRKKLPQV